MTDRQKVPTSDFQSETHTSKIIWIFLINSIFETAFSSKIMPNFWWNKMISFKYNDFWPKIFLWNLVKLEFLSFVIWIRNKYTWFSVLYLLCISQVLTDELCLSSRYNINWRVPRPAHVFIGPAGKGSYRLGALHYTLRHTLHQNSTTEMTLTYSICN